MGKTTVLDTVTTGAAHNGVRVLRAAGMQFDADINYAGLKPLLVPLFNDFDILDDVHRDALRAAVGIRCRPAPDGLLTSTAVLLLLRLISAPERRSCSSSTNCPGWTGRPTPCSASWPDGSSAAVSASSRPPVRAPTASPSRVTCPSTGSSRWTTLRRPSCSHSHTPTSPAGTAPHRGQARGNPSALVELPMAPSAEQPAILTAAPTPLSECLQVMFASRVAGLPDRSRELLLIADRDGTGDLAPSRRPRLAELPSTTSFPPSGTTW
ncbi:hypothetical protein [Streptomyces mirabilis]|uniref:hypothetical protein n=2 Tax=Streptomyces mirabilis TaxID=68239 RepID=UPI003333888E